MKRMMLRHYIGRRLGAYYNQPSDLVVGSIPPSNPPLNRLWGEWHWKRINHRLYETQQGQWLTPVELFRPHYSNILAEFIANHNSRDDGGRGGSSAAAIEIFELGGGRGTNAWIVLNHLRQHHPLIYDRISSYTIVDASPTLHELQQKRLVHDNPDDDNDENNDADTTHASKLNFVLKDLGDVADQRSDLWGASDTRTVVLGLELLDNLGHDKVRLCPQTHKLQQAVVLVASDDDEKNDTEMFYPLDDSLLSEIIVQVPSYSGRRVDSPQWVPSVACGVLQHLFRQRPNTQLLLADFDWLPEPNLTNSSSAERSSTWAQGEPLVTCMDGSDHECYLNAPILSDILFPTNFGQLAKFLQKNIPSSARVQVQKQSQFLRLHGQDEIQKTRSWLTGYSPLVDDFGNCSIITVT